MQENGLLPKEYIEELVTLKKEIESTGHEVVLAHEREKWGKGLLPPEVCTKLDFDKISEADVVIAYPGNPPSGGVHIELGWASALGKKIVIIMDHKDRYSPLVSGLHTITSVIYINDKKLSVIIDKLRKILKIL